MTLATTLGKITPDRSTFAVLLLLLAIVVVGGGLVAPVTGAVWTHYRSVGALKDRFANYAEVARDIETLQTQYEAQKGQDEETGQFAAAASGGEAAALMERNLREAITGAGGRLERVERLPLTNEVLGERFGVKVSFGGPIRAIDVALERVGLAFPYYYFEDMVLESRDASADEVTGQMTVTSFRRIN